MVVLLGALVLGLMAAGCGGQTEPTVVEPTADPAVAAPTDMVAAREGVLGFLRTSANQCVPPEGAGWRAEPGGPNTPAGYEVFRFYSDDCVMTVSHPLGEEGDVYHVAIGDTLTAFCWQAIVDGQGQVIATGMDAQSIPGLGNPAAQYCEEQGYAFDILDRDSGGQCGVCVFPDGSMCNVWGFFHGICGPGDFPAAEP